MHRQKSIALYGNCAYSTSYQLDCRMKTLPKLYVKKGCPWCREALSYFQQHGVEIDIRDVNLSRQNMQRMAEISGQSKTPTLEYGDFIVADFSVDELIDQLADRPEIRLELGIPDHLEDD